MLPSTAHHKIGPPFSQQQIPETGILPEQNLVMCECSLSAIPRRGVVPDLGRLSIGIDQSATLIWTTFNWALQENTPVREPSTLYLAQ
jgi:hypothetical protein